jgi:hypothetical protein
MFRIRTTLAIAAAFAVAACATGYGPKSIGGGYADERVDDSHYRVKFQGNGYASQDRVWNFWMYRCAELTKQKGYTHFALQKPGQPQSQAPQAAGMQAAAYRQQTYRHDGYRPGLFRQAGYHEGAFLGEEGDGLEPGMDDAPRMLRTKGGGATYVPIYIPGSTIRTWHSDAIVAMFKEPLPENVVVLKAQAVLDDLDPYIKSNGATPPPLRDEVFRRAATVNRPRTGYQFGGPL